MTRRRAANKDKSENMGKRRSCN